MTTQATKTLLPVVCCFIFMALFAACSPLYACEISTVTLEGGESKSEAETNGKDDMYIANSGTAYFYAVCTVTANPVPYDLEWEYELDGEDDDYDEDNAESDYPDYTDDTASKSYSSTTTGIKVRVRFKDFVGDPVDNPWVYSNACTVTIVTIEITDPDSGSFPKSIGIDTGLTLVSEITPAAATGGTYTWSVESGPGTATFSPSGDSTTSFSAGAVGDYTVKVEYAIGGGTCSDTAGTIKVVNAKMIFMTGIPAEASSSLTRAESGTFEIVDDAGSIISGAIYENWAFEAEDDDGVNASDSSHTDSTWSGTIVEPGTASCDVTFGGNTAKVSKAITVNDRTGWAVDLGFNSDVSNTHFDFPTTGAAEYGTACNQSTLAAPLDNILLSFVITHDVVNKTNYADNYTTAEVGSGPNKDVW